MIKVKEKAFNIFRGLLVILLFYNSVVLQYLPFKLFNANVNDYIGNSNLSVYLIAFADLIVLFIILLIYKKELMEEAKIFIKDIKNNINIGFSCWVIGFIIMIISNLIILYVFKSNGANNENAVRALVKASPFVMGITTCFIAPFIEEVVFRKTIRDVFPQPYLLVPLSFLFFGAAHVASMATNFVDWLYIIPYGTLGGTFAFAYYKTKTVFTSYTFHMIHNTLVVVLLLLV